MTATGPTWHLERERTMRMKGKMKRSWRSWSVATVILAAAAVGFNGCCCNPKVCNQGTDYIVTIFKKDGQCFICPDDGAEWKVEAGETIQFDNRTRGPVTVEAGLAAYDEGHIFTIDKCSSMVRTVADLPEGADEREILHTIKCGKLDHGGPKVVVTEPIQPGGEG
jgi:hypothetical protein